MNTFIEGLRYAWRQLRKRLGFALVAVLTLRLGIAANTAIFSVIESVRLRTLPLAMAGSRFLDSMLYELSPFDRLRFVLAAGAIALVGTVAAFLPAGREGKLDPMVVLRYE